MDKEDAWDEVIDRLEAIDDIQKVYEGYVDPNSIPHSHYPCIIAEPKESNIDEDFIDYEVASCSNEIFWIDLFILFKLYQKGKQVTGTASIKGMLDLEEDVREALCAAPIKLGGLVVRVLFGNTYYGRSSPELPKQQQLRSIQIELGLRMIISTKV